MSEETCAHDCGSCGSDCAGRNMRAELHAGSTVKKVIGIVSGKGGVGKSLVTALLASRTQRAGLRAAVLDADITGPSIPQSFGLEGTRALGADGAIAPVVSKSGVQLMSMNFLVENATDPVIWRGTMISSAVRQFWTDVDWQSVDCMFVDMPPGTGDVPLTVFQSLPVDGIIIVTSPQQLVGTIVQKAVNMAREMGIAVLGLIENMSYVVCPDCNKKIRIYGAGVTDEIALRHGIPVLARIPVEERIAAAVDSGDAEGLAADCDWLDAALAVLK